MSFNSKYSGQQVESLLDQVASGNTGGSGGGDGITTELDPIFSASPAAKITDEDISSWNNKVDKVDGKQLSTEDFTTLLKQKLDSLYNYNDTEIQNDVSKLRTDLDTLVSGNVSSAVESFNEIIAFLEGIEDSQSLDSIIASIEQQIAAKQDKLISGTNIKTINGQSILGSGNIEINGGEGGGSSSDGRKEVIYFDNPTISNMRPNVIYWVEGYSDFTIESFEDPIYEADTYDVFTVVLGLGVDSSSAVTLTLPDDVCWANGVIPEIVIGDYELSISRISDGDVFKYFAVLTPFNLI